MLINYLTFVYKSEVVVNKFWSIIVNNMLCEYNMLLYGTHCDGNIIVKLRSFVL